MRAGCQFYRFYADLVTFFQYTVCRQLVKTRHVMGVTVIFYASSQPWHSFPMYGLQSKSFKTLPVVTEKKAALIFVRAPDSQAAPCQVLQGSLSTGLGWPKIHVINRELCLLLQPKQTKQQSLQWKSPHSLNQRRPVRSAAQPRASCWVLDTHRVLNHQLTPQCC